MLKMITEHSETGEPLLMFGLSEMNIQKLKEDKPIFIDLKELGLEGGVLIFYGETEEKMYADLLKQGVKIDNVIDGRNDNAQT